MRWAIYKRPQDEKATLVRQLSTFSKAETRFVAAPFNPQDFPVVNIAGDEVMSVDVAGNDALTHVDMTLVDDGRGQYEKNFKSCLNELQEQKFTKIVLSRCEEYLCENDEGMRMRLFARACRAYPENFVAMWTLPSGETWLTMTPEILLKRRGMKCEVMALAGTEAYTETLAKDVEAWTEKNREEQWVVSDFVRCVLEKEVKDVEASSVRPVKTGDLLHLCTDFTFDLKSLDQQERIVKALHPTPAVCGFPREETMTTINETEPERRYYSGYAGPVSKNECDLYVTLRCVEFPDSRHLRLYAGGGLLKESTLESEWEETVRKMGTVKAVLGI